MNTADILERAATLIEERGWNQGWYVNGCGGLCTTGAMFAAVGMEPVLGQDSNWNTFNEIAFRSAQAAWDRFTAHVAQHAPQWNDAPERTKEEVVSTLRAAAQAARAEQ